MLPTEFLRKQHAIVFQKSVCKQSHVHVQANISVHIRSHMLSGAIHVTV